jgi:mRNA-degrading endonuclease toxin of MazEF toxin-antitoxin module
MLKYIISLFDWCKINILLVENKRNIYFKKREIWWCSIGLNIGEEEFGKGLNFRRPVLIFKKFTANSFLGLPLTSIEKEGSWYAPITVLEKNGSVMLNQARIFDKKRLSVRIETMTVENFNSIKERFISFYDS